MARVTVHVFMLHPYLEARVQWAMGNGQWAMGNGRPHCTLCVHHCSPPSSVRATRRQSLLWLHANDAHLLRARVSMRLLKRRPACSQHTTHTLQVRILIHFKLGLVRLLKLAWLFSNLIAMSINLSVCFFASSRFVRADLSRPLGTLPALGSSPKSPSWPRSRHQTGPTG